jgi:hypothetical protein
MRCSRWSGRSKVPDLRDLGRLLRDGREWRRDEIEGEQNNER